MKEKLLHHLSKMDSQKKLNIGLIAVLVVLILGSVLLYNKIFVKPIKAPLDEIDLPFDPEGPYAILVPRRDGNAIVLDIKRVADVDAIAYDLTYQSEGIDRGVHGDVKKLESADKKAEYSQEILLGTCSQGFTTGSAHCVFDKKVENGTLTLHIVKGSKGYRMIIAWHLQKPDVALGVVTSADNHFTYSTTSSREALTVIAYTIVNDLSGVPKLPPDKKIIGKVYSLNVPVAQIFPAGGINIELASAPSKEAKIARYDDSKNSWDILDTKLASSSSTLTAQSPGSGIFAILSTSSK